MKKKTNEIDNHFVVPMDEYGIAPHDMSNVELTTFKDADTIFNELITEGVPAAMFKIDNGKIQYVNDENPL